MIDFLAAWAQRTPDAPAFIEPGLTVTYRELFQGAQAAAAWLHDCGVRARDIVALSLNPRPAHSRRQLSLIYGLFQLGAPVLPLYPDVPPAVRGPLAARFDARWFITADSLEGPPHCGRLDPTAFDPESEQWREAPAPRERDPASPLRYEFTSGTTGEPKVVMFTREQYAAIASSNARCFGWTAGDRLLPVVGWPGKVGMRGLAQMNTVGGALVNVPIPETRDRLADTIERFGITCIRTVPWQLRRLIASAAPSRWPPLLRFLETAGSPIAPEEIRAVRARISPPLRVSYGSSESGVMAHLRGDEPPEAALLPVPGMEAQAVDEKGAPLPAGRVGRLRFRAPWLPSAYIGNGKATAERFADGWYYPGDAGSIDTAGRVAVRGRMDGVINYGGSKTLPRDIELVLEQHPDVAEATVIGVPHPTRGEVPVAFVVQRRSVTARAISEFCEERMEAWRVPALILTVENIPRGTDGKVARSRLESIYGEWARLYLK